MNRLRSALLMISLMIIASLAFMPEAYAGLSVRTGEHEGYSRLVFAWDKSVPKFQTKKLSGDRTEYQFSQDVTPEEVAGISAAYLKEIEILSHSPLTLRLSIFDKGNIRNFSIGKRVIIDLYGPPGSRKASEKKKPLQAKQEKPVEKAPVQKPKRKSAKAHGAALQTFKTEKESKAQEHKASKQKTNPTVTSPVQKPDDKHLKPVGAEDHHGSPSVKTKNGTLTAHAPEPITASPNLISLSAADNFNMAIFENHGKIFMMVDHQTQVNKPQVSGKNAKYFLPVRHIELEGAQGYMVPTLPGTLPRVEGGHLIWNLIISPDTQEREHSRPNYINVQDEKVRGGSLFWPLDDVQKVMEFNDPETGERIIFVTVPDAKSYIGGPRHFVDFDLLPSYAGLAIRPKVDDLEVQKAVEGIEIIRRKARGLALTPEAMVKAEQARKEAKENSDEETDIANENWNTNKLFDFKRWSMGGEKSLNQNRNIILSSLSAQSDADQIQNLIVLARMHIANGRGAETLGFLTLAEQKIPDLVQSPQFLALRGAAKAFDWKFDSAFHDFFSQILDDYEEAKYWRAFILAGLGDWQQAAAVLPENLEMVENYTAPIRNRLSPVLAEIKLRAGEVESAESILSVVEQKSGPLNIFSKAQQTYLKGEAARQKGKTAETIKLWKPLTTGPDDLYRAKAGLALTRLLVEEKKLSPKEAINNMERLRYAWRGDVLEAHINYWLGRTYFEAGQHMKGLKILRNAIPLSVNTPLAQRVAEDMSTLYTGYFTGKELDRASPLDAVAFYEEFTELLPSGSKGNQVIKRLAEHLVKADLLDRASNLLSYQIDHRLKGEEAVQTAVRLAAIRLINKDAQGAMIALSKGENILRTLSPEFKTPKRLQEIALLRARALSQDKRSGQALALLEELPQNSAVNRLRADIAWQNSYWEDAAFALSDIILDENISLTRPLTEDQAKLILHRAVALNLANDRIALANIREKYSEAMAQTKAAKKFDVVTRPRQSTGLADRNTMLSAVSEVDLFKDFLDSYRKPEPE